MIHLFLLLIIEPALLGLFIKRLVKIKSSGYSSFCFSLGFLAMIAEFAFVCYPSIYLNIPFHTVCKVICLVYLIESVAILFWLLYSKQTNIKKYLSKEKLLPFLHSPFFWIMVAFCSFQIIRLFIAEPFQLRDSKTYNALITDILQSDRLFRLRPEDGYPLESILDSELKYILSPWYPCISMFAYVSKLHPLIISNSILPSYILFIHYLILYSLGFCLFDSNHKEAFLFTSLSALIHEVTLFCHVPTMIKLVWPMWGKGVLSMTVVPAILILFMLYVDNAYGTTSLWVIIVFFLVVAGCSMSTMAALVLPLELGILGLVRTIRQRSVKPLLYIVLTSIPALIYVLVYYYLSSLQA